MEFDARQYLKQQIEAGKDTVVDIASSLKMNVGTVYRFLQGKPVHRSTEARFIEYASNKVSPEEPRRSTG